ncbi:universal stress protein [Streptomyces sp. NPDC051677]|uniref:universal stress protein n=1 Tax=Streptomyces sp. NPDC051677 TaxID=3365669 RepID=UPI0037D6776B
MERMILACADPSARDHSAVVEWAREEARLRRLPMRVVLCPRPEAGMTHIVVCAMPWEAAADGRPLDSCLPPAGGVPDRPLVAVPDGPASSCRSGKVLLGVDARDPSDSAIRFAFDSARIRGARLHVVHAWALPSDAAAWPFDVPERERATWEDHEVQLLADVLRPWREKYPEVAVQEDVLLLEPAQALLHHGEHAALVVVGGKPGTEWGEVVPALLREATHPVAVVPTRAQA